MEDNQQRKQTPSGQQRDGTGSGNPSDQRYGDDSAQSAVRQRERTFQINLVCNNCVLLSTYEFPVRHRFYGYAPALYNTDGEEIHHQVWSRVGNPTNEAKADLVFCQNCKVPMLSGAPMNYPPSYIGVAQ